MQAIFVGRQPIFNQRLDVVAYELLFRNSTENAAHFTDGDIATCNLLLNTLVEIGLGKLVGDRLAYVNCTRSFITGRYPLPFAKDRMVLEVLEDIEADEDLIDALQEFKQNGYEIVLDDFVYREGLDQLLPLADVIKLDYRDLGHDQAAADVEILRKYPAKLLAEKVESLDEFERCRELGFDYFQGYFLNRPQVIQGRRIPNNRLGVMQILAKLQDPDVGFEELERLICHDVSLSYKLLTYINSAAVGIRRKVSSIQQALTLLGLKHLQLLVTLIMLSDLEDKPVAVMNTAMMRGRMCELLGQAMQRDDAQSFFTVGLFSTLEVILESPMEEILRELPLSDDVKGALLHFEGAMGSALRCTLDYEQGDWDQVRCLHLDEATIRQAFVEATAWAEANEGMARQLKAAKPGNGDGNASTRGTEPTESRHPVTV